MRMKAKKARKWKQSSIAKLKRTLAAKEAAKASKWTTLVSLINDYGDACRADEMKGGGDPNSIPEIELQLELARLKLYNHIDRVRRELEGTQE